MIPIQRPIRQDKTTLFEYLQLSELEQAVLAHLDDSQFNGHRLSRVCCLSRTQLYRRIKALTGLSVSHYIRSVRLRRACELLQHPELSVMDVAFMVGFNDLSYFYRSFREAYHMTPGEMRRI